MAINIKDEAAIAKLRRLSQLTGHSMSKELAASIDERLRRVEAAQPDRLARVMQLAEATAAVWPEHLRMGDPTAELYDEHGLPA